MGTRFSPFYNLRKITTLKVVRKKEKILITNQEKQTEEHKKWVQFVQQLIDDLKTITVDDIKTFYSSREVSHTTTSVYWDSFSHKLTFFPFRGETYSLGAVFFGSSFRYFKDDVEMIVTQKVSLLEDDFKKKLLNPEVLGEKVMGMDNHTRYFDEENYFGGIYPLKLLTPNEKKHLIELIYRFHFERYSGVIISKDYHLMDEFQFYQPVLDELIEEDVTTIVDFLVKGDKNSYVSDLNDIFKILFDELCYSTEARREIAHRIIKEVIGKLELEQFQEDELFIHLNKTIEFLICTAECFRYNVYYNIFSDFVKFLLQKINGHLHIKNLILLPEFLEKFKITPQPFLNENVQMIEMDDFYINSLFQRCEFSGFFKSLNQHCFTNKTFALRLRKDSSSNPFQFWGRVLRFLEIVKNENFLERFEFYLADDLIEDFKFISQRPELFLNDQTSKEQVDEIISLFKI